MSEPQPNTKFFAKLVFHYKSYHEFICKIFKAKLRDFFMRSVRRLIYQRRIRHIALNNTRPKFQFLPTNIQSRRCVSFLLVAFFGRVIRGIVYSSHSAAPSHSLSSTLLLIKFRTRNTSMTNNIWQQWIFRRKRNDSKNNIKVNILTLVL